MCGICGIQGADFNGNGKIFKRLLIENELRGKEAAGVIWLNNKEELVKTSKAPGTASKFLSKHITIADWSATRYIIGHTRLATSGSPKDNKENHPHSYGNWTVVHNGIISNTTELYKELNITPTVQCDSAIIPIVFEKYGFKGGLEKLAGGFAIAAVNKNQPTKIFLAKNGSYSNTIYIGKTRENMIFSSIEESIKKHTKDYFKANSNSYYIYEGGTQISKGTFKPALSPAVYYYDWDKYEYDKDSWYSKRLSGRDLKPTDFESQLYWNLVNNYYTKGESKLF